MPPRSLRSWLLAGWLLSLGGCASEEGHRHDDAHAHAEESPLHDATHALQARMKADHERVHEGLDHAEADQEAWEARRPGEPALAEHRQVLVGLGGVLERRARRGEVAGRSAPDPDAGVGSSRSAAPDVVAGRPAR